MEMIALDDNVEGWFKDVIGDTKDKIEEQAKSLGKPAPKSAT